MARKQDTYYFESFVTLSDYSCRAAQCLKEILENFDKERLPQKLEEMHHIEHTADVEKHEVMAKLVKEFITPIEREDIMLILQKIDDVTDTIEDAVRKMYMYNVTRIPEEAKRFADIILSCCEAMRHAIAEFQDFKRSITLRDDIIAVNAREEEGDRLHCDAIHALHVTEKDYLRVYRWTRMYDCMENCCDACEDVSDAIETVIMKNT